MLAPRQSSLTRSPIRTLRHSIWVMPLQGDYEPSTSSWSRKQTELFEATNGEEGGDLRGRADHRADLGRCQDREDPEDPPDARGTRRPLRGGRVARRRPEASRLVLQLEEEPTRGAAGPRNQARLHGTRGHRRREDRVVGSRGRGMARLRDVPDEDRPADPGVRARARGVAQSARVRVSDASDSRRAQAGPIGTFRAHAQDSRRRDAGRSCRRWRRMSDLRRDRSRTFLHSMRCLSARRGPLAEERTASATQRRSRDDEPESKLVVGQRHDLGQRDVRRSGSISAVARVDGGPRLHLRVKSHLGGDG